jgi:hypothetical protein
MCKILSIALALTMTVSAAVRIEKTAWKGWPNCYRISNGEVELIVTSDVGPRVMRYAFIGGQNLLKEYADQLGKSGEKEFQLRGGHRIWVAPETLATSWAPENVPVKIEIEGDVLTATEPVEPSTGVQKQMVIRMAASGSNVELIHRVKNHNAWTIEFAPWTLSMMAPNGTAIFGFPPRGKHPEMLLPTNPLVMWAYTDFSDKRWTFTKKYMALRQDSGVSAPQKIGLFNKHSWGAYLLGSDLFVKQTTADPTRTYPDFGCSVESFVNDVMLEIETLGPMQKVDPGASAEHIERWSLHKDVHVATMTDEALDAVLVPALAH